MTTNKDDQQRREAAQQMGQGEFLLVGSHFCPPAKAILQVVKQGAEVTLTPEPDNPYDPLAIVVWLSGTQIEPNAAKAIEHEFNGYGTDLAELTPDSMWKLGHIGASEGKPLRDAKLTTGGDLIGTEEYHAKFGETEQIGQLRFTSSTILIRIK